MAERTMAVQGALTRAVAALRDLCIGAAGADAYGNYLAHQRAHHPTAAPLTREQFAREALVARWNGVTRCC